MAQEERKIRLLRCRRAERFCNLRAKCGQAIWRGTAKLLSYLVDLIGIEPMTSSMPWKRAPSCATGPHVAEMQLFYSLRWGGIRQTSASIGDGARLPWGMRILPGLQRKEGSADEMVQGTAGGELSGSGNRPDGPLRGGARRKRRDREHCGGVPVSKRIWARNLWA